MTTILELGVIVGLSFGFLFLAGFLKDLVFIVASGILCFVAGFILLQSPLTAVSSIMNTGLGVLFILSGLAVTFFGVNEQ